MQSKDTGKEASCSECPSTFRLVPPADTRYSNPREKLTGDDFIKRVYECEDNSHLNTIFWESDTPRKIFVVSKDPREDIDYYGTSLY